MPLPDASPAPPPSGIYGLPLTPYGEDEMREKLPDGGYIKWGKEKRPKDGAIIWTPQDYVEPSEKIQS